MMNKIVCLGSSHTEGGWGGKNKEFENSWPGQLQQYLGSSSEVINCGEASYSIDFWPTKVINIINEINPTHILIEINRKEKLDVEVTSEFTGESVNSSKNYHPLYTRQDVSSSKGRTNNKRWPNRTSVSNGEAIDYYNIFYNLSKKDIEEYYGGSYPKAIAESFQDVSSGVLTDVEKSWVHDKLNDMLKAMGNRKKDLELLLNYLYFRAVYYDNSDQDISNYLQNINNIRMICKENNVKLRCFTMHDKPWLGSQIYKDAYKDKFKDIWLFDDNLFQLKGWVRERYGNDYQSTLGDSIHYYPWVFKTWIEEKLGPWLKERFL